jgi:hypothetical protein
LRVKAQTHDVNGFAGEEVRGHANNPMPTLGRCRHGVGRSYFVMVGESPQLTDPVLGMGTCGQRLGCERAVKTDRQCNDRRRGEYTAQSVGGLQRPLPGKPGTSPRLAERLTSSR